MTAAATPPVAKLVFDAPVREVTLLEDRAQVRRRGTAPLPAGRVKVRVRGLAPVLVDRTLHAAIRTPEGAPTGEAVRLIDARVERAYRPAGERRETAGGEAGELARELEADLAALGRHQKTLDQQRQLVDEIAHQALADLAVDVAWGVETPEEWSAGLAALGEREGKHRRDDLELGWREEELRQRLADLRRRVSAAGRPDLHLTVDVEVELEVAAAGEFLLELGYVVPAACWRPAHTARLLDGGGDPRVAFATDACVWQRTGEDWEDVELRFSTQRSAAGHEPPLLRDDRIATQEKPEEIVVEAREVEIQTTGPGSPAGESAVLPGIDDGGSARVLAGRERATVPSDGRPYRVAVSDFAATAASEHLLAPELAAAVVHRLTLENAGSGPILAGPVDLVAGSGPVGRTQVLFAAPGERFDLGFGPDPAIRVRRQSDRVEEEPSVLSRHTRTRHTVTVQLSNIGTEPRTFTVRERLPVSEIEQVRVKLDDKATTPAARPDADGFVDWRVTLPGGGHQTLKLSYAIARRKDVQG